MDKVAVIVPCRNEKMYISQFLSTLEKQILDNICLTVILADGMSDDGTRVVLKEYEPRNFLLKVIDNEGLIVSSGLNLAIQYSDAEYIIRMDVHTSFAPDYIRMCVKALKKTNADCVGGPWIADGSVTVQKAIACAFRTRFGSGGAKSRSKNYSGNTDTVYLGAWKKETFQKYGLFDNELVRNQDDEFNLRVKIGGGTVWQDNSIKSIYYPRSSWFKLAKQFMQYGYWKVYVIKKHKRAAALRHLMPSVFFLTVAILFCSSFFSTTALYLAFYILSFYLLVLFVSSYFETKSIVKRPPIHMIIFAQFIMHQAYGFGFIIGLINYFLNFKSASKMRSLSR